MMSLKLDKSGSIFRTFCLSVCVFGSRWRKGGEHLTPHTPCYHTSQQADIHPHLVWTNQTNSAFYYLIFSFFFFPPLMYSVFLVQALPWLPRHFECQRGGGLLNFDRHTHTFTIATSLHGLLFLTQRRVKRQPWWMFWCVLMFSLCHWTGNILKQCIWANSSSFVITHLSPLALILFQFASS